MQRRPGGQGEGPQQGYPRVPGSPRGYPTPAQSAATAVSRRMGSHQHLDACLPWADSAGAGGLGSVGICPDALLLMVRDGYSRGSPAPPHEPASSPAAARPAVPHDLASLCQGGHERAAGRWPCEPESHRALTGCTHPLSAWEPRPGRCPGCATKWHQASATKGPKGRRVPSRAPAPLALLLPPAACATPGVLREGCMKLWPHGNQGWCGLPRLATAPLEPPPSPAASARQCRPVVAGMYCRHRGSAS